MRYAMGKPVAMAAALAILHVTPAATADPNEQALNGRYVATSIGNMAKTNEVFRPEGMKRNIWTISTSCEDFLACGGTVTSDEGWSAPITFISQNWFVRRDIPEWGPCPDGIPFPAKQVYRFVPISPDNKFTPGSPLSAGEDTTYGASGACGIGQPLTIRMPFRLDRID
ncbi:hypothetical protein [Mycolicibacterium sp. 018/SC-01/001]|uniref:hypothetical protein n=1 Tax=Mycolicibacterium sp. 018/SC-01/001 TaxID=2592069 RepID=UPI002103D548|nr:hypothetical protein [Mycolicibacterium sp. 018/SC-01/001]